MSALIMVRAQIILFVDNPLDYLIFGHWHRENTKEEAVMMVEPAQLGGTRHLSAAQFVRDQHDAVALVASQRAVRASTSVINSA